MNDIEAIRKMQKCGIEEVRLGLEEAERKLEVLEIMKTICPSMYKYYFKLLEKKSLNEILNDLKEKGE